jgi:group I intron endonuclease
MGFVYLVRNIEDGKCYVGQTRRKKAEDRWNQHRWSITRPKENGVLKRAMKLHGLEKFSFEVICEIPNEDLDAREIHEIAERDTIAPKGYNLQKGGRMTTAHPSTREKLSQANKGKRTGYKHTEESKRKMSESSKGPKSYLFGVKLTDEQRKQKMLDSTLAKKVNQYTLDGKFIKTWMSVSQVHRELKIKEVSKTCNGVLNTQGGFKWTWYTGSEEYVKPSKVARDDERRRKDAEYREKNRDRVNAQKRARRQALKNNLVSEIKE